MASAIESLIQASENEKKERGTEFTPAEIFQQPFIWRDSFRRVKEAKDDVVRFLTGAGILGGNRPGRIYMAGAGTSDFVGRSLKTLVRNRLQVEADHTATTDLVTHPDSWFLQGAPTVLVSFARSGNSPESVGAYVLANESEAKVKHLVITCNKDGALAKRAKENPEDCQAIILHDKSNDQSLAMTSSFSGMVVAMQAVCHIEDLDEYEPINEALASAAEGVMVNYSDTIQEICGKDFQRAVFLGSGALWGCATESHLKLQEMTDGGVIAKYDTFVGLRHGPQAVIHDDTLVVYYLSSDPFVRRYELDLMAENQEKGIGMTRVVVCNRATSEIERLADYVIEYNPDGKYRIPDLYRPPLDVTVGQMIGLFKSIDRGLKPDNPSVEGVIHRVVEGIKIYDRPEFAQSGEFKVIAG
ncbi:SIS domain-containing protein [candidate division KSB1 bacterium]